MSAVSPATAASDPNDLPQSPIKDEEVDEDEDECEEDPSFHDWTASLVSLSPAVSPFTMSTVTYPLSLRLYFNCTGQATQELGVDPEKERTKEQSD